MAADFWNMYTESRQVERKTLTILKVLGSLQEPAGSRVISRSLKDLGVDLSERSVRYHLKITDERGLTQLVNDRDGRIITDKGMREIRSALVNDKVGFVSSRIELLAFHTSFDCEKPGGLLPVNISFFQKEKSGEALRAMAPAFERGLCTSRLVITADGGGRIGDVPVPAGLIGLATVCSIAVNGCLLKAGIPMDSRFGGLLEMQDYEPVRFTEAIHYGGSSLDPSEMFIKARMTSVSQVARTGSGEVLANFREIPAMCRPLAERVIEKLRNAGLGGVLLMGDTSCPVCEMDVRPNRIGIVLLGGLNPAAAAAEAGIEAENQSMSTLIEYRELVNFEEILRYQDASDSQMHV